MNLERRLAGCRRPGCDGVILWLTHVGTGRMAPIDADPSPKGNIAIDLERGQYTVLSGEQLEEVRGRGEELRVNHFYTCENPPQR
jgi:hypothetical protein